MTGLDRVTGGSRPRPDGPLVALLSLLLATVAAIGLPLLRPPEWAASVTAALGPAEQVRPVTPYVYHVLSRPQVVATHAAVLEDPSFLRRAGDQLGLDRARLRQARVDVSQVPRSAVLGVTVTSPHRTDAAALAPAVAEAGAAYVQRLGSLYVLRSAGAGDYPVEVRRLPRYGPSTGVVFLAGLLPAFLLSWVLLASAARRRATRRPGAGDLPLR